MELICYCIKKKLFKSESQRIFPKRANCAVIHSEDCTLCVLAWLKLATCNTFHFLHFYALFAYFLACINWQKCVHFQKLFYLLTVTVDKIRRFFPWFRVDHSDTLYIFRFVPTNWVTIIYMANYLSYLILKLWHYTSAIGNFREQRSVKVVHIFFFPWTHNWDRDCAYACGSDLAICTLKVQRERNTKCTLIK